MLQFNRFLCRGHIPKTGTPILQNIIVKYLHICSRCHTISLTTCDQDHILWCMSLHLHPLLWSEKQNDDTCSMTVSLSTCILYRLGCVRKTFFELTLVWLGFPFVLEPECHKKTLSLSVNIFKDSSI